MTPAARFRRRACSRLRLRARFRLRRRSAPTSHRVRARRRAWRRISAHIVYHLRMTTSTPTPSFTLDVLPDRLAICRLDPEHADFDWDPGEGLLSVTFTDEEVSLVCEEGVAPADAEVSRGWRCLRVDGPLDLGMVGVLAALAGALAGAGVAVFVLSTFDTDHLLVPGAQLDRAIDCLQAAGHVVRA